MNSPENAFLVIRETRETGETGEKSGTGESGKEVLSSELETDGKNGTGDGPRFSELRTQNLELQVPIVVLFKQTNNPRLAFDTRLYEQIHKYVLLQCIKMNTSCLALYTKFFGCAFQHIHLPRLTLTSHFGRSILQAGLFGLFGLSCLFG